MSELSPTNAPRSTSAPIFAPQPAPVDPTLFRLTPLGQHMCRLCGALVDYFDGRGLHERWHLEAGR